MIVGIFANVTRNEFLRSKHYGRFNQTIAPLRCIMHLQSDRRSREFPIEQRHSKDQCNNASLSFLLLSSWFDASPLFTLHLSELCLCFEEGQIVHLALRGNMLNSIPHEIIIHLSLITD